MQEKLIATNKLLQYHKKKKFQKKIKIFLCILYEYKIALTLQCREQSFFR